MGKVTALVSMILTTTTHGVRAQLRHAVTVPQFPNKYVRTPYRTYSKQVGGHSLQNKRNVPTYSLYQKHDEGTSDTCDTENKDTKTLIQVIFGGIWSPGRGETRREDKGVSTSTIVGHERRTSRPLAAKRHCGVPTNNTRNSNRRSQRRIQVSTKRPFSCSLLHRM